MSKSGPLKRTGASSISAAKAAKIDIANLPACVEDARAAGVEKDAGPDDPKDYAQLNQRLEQCRIKLPPLYRTNVLDPFLHCLKELGEEGFKKVLARDAHVQGPALVIFDVAQAVLQNGEGYAERPTDGFQEVVSDLYDGFLSAADRRDVKPPSKSVIAPLVKWGRPENGPYTLPSSAVEIVGSKAPIVSLPPANSRAGLLAWAALGHETAGHDILGADEGLRPELENAVYQALKAKNMGMLGRYWADRIDETVSDVLGIMNMGPAAAIAIVGYFRGLNAAWGSGPHLRSDGPAGDEHPADVLRGYLAASAVRLLSFSGAKAWAAAVEAQTDEDVQTIKLAGNVVSREQAKRSAAIAAQTIMRVPMKSLADHALGQIQDWLDNDEKIVAQLRSLFTSNEALPGQIAAGYYAAHAVAAGVTASLAREAQVGQIFGRMVDTLKAMHDSNPSWGPLYVVHPGDVAPHLGYCRTLAA